VRIATVEAVPGDGSCFFHCLALRLAFFERPPSAAVIRARCADFWGVKGRASLLVALEGDKGARAADLLASMRGSGFASTGAFLAAAEIFKLKLFVLDAATGSVSCFGREGGIVTRLLLQNEHFWLVKGRSRRNLG
jgi:hypothetical protein